MNLTSRLMILESVQLVFAIPAVVLIIGCGDYEKLPDETVPAETEGMSARRNVKIAFSEDECIFAYVKHEKSLIVAEPLLIADDVSLEDDIEQFVLLSLPFRGLFSDPWGDDFCALPPPISHPPRHYDIDFDPFVRIVSQGPRSMAALLEHLDDKRRTGLFLRFPSLSQETMRISINPLNEREIAPAKLLLDLGAREPSSLSEYNVTVGDICIAALGQIVGRDYSPIVPTTSRIVINSPIINESLCETVRKIWTAPNGREVLHLSLLNDWYLRSSFNGEAFDQCWMRANSLQCSGIKRLLYYFPESGVDLACERLRTLRLAPIAAAGESRKGSLLRDAANGLILLDFVEAVRWHSSSRIKEELDRVREESGDSGVVKILNEP